MKKEPGMAYNMKTLNKVFAILSVVFLIAIVWVVLDDYIRPWKVVQVKGMKVKGEVLKEKILAEEKSIDSEKLAEVKSNIESAQKNLDANEEKVETLEDDLAEVRKSIYLQNMTNGENGSKSQEFQFKYEHAKVAGHSSHEKKYAKKMDAFKALFAKGKDDLKTYQSKEKELIASLKLLNDEKVNAEGSLKKLTGVKSRLIAAYESTQPSPVWALRNMPFIDFLDPTIKIDQIVVENVTEDRYFQQVPRVDRCTTCHLFIDQPGFEDKENPYRTHPKVETLAVGLKSAHPKKKFGCTSCHQGEGHRVFDFNAPVHTPQTAEQGKEWAEKYHWHEPHKIPQPMYPLNHTEASCTKCHGDQQHIPMATKLNEGKKLIKTYGCYACHKIEGWEHLKKPAPSLKKITGKTNKEFMKNWIWAPHNFNKHSKMPAFFNQSNNKQPEHKVKNIAEVNAMAEYLAEKSEKYKPLVKYVGGNSENGKELIQTIGCVGCHQVEGIDEPYNLVKSRKGAYLTGTGSKVDPDWLVSWLKKPKHYQADTIMPSFRLSDTEANDIAAYLMSLKNKTFEELEFSPLDKKVRDDLLVEYFSAFEPIDAAKKKLAVMSDHERTMELGKRSIGKYGCYSCHDIEGFAPDRAPIGPELTKVGSKPITQFGYGQQHDNVGHTRQEWFSAHLKNPKVWDIGVPKQFKDLNRMPNFYLTDKEISSMVTVLLGQVSDFVPLAGKKNLNASEKLAEDGKKVVEKFNCQGCHKIDGVGGDILAAYEDDYNQGPPYLVKEGHRVDSQWFYNFLKKVHPIRPYVKVRMPSFNYTNDELNKIISYFNAESAQVSFSTKPDFVAADGSVKWLPGEKAAAKEMWDELACTSCHSGGFNNEEAQGPNLHFAKKRLRPDWVQNVWLKDPTKVMPYTVMPNFWEGGTVSAVEGVLGDDPKKQIQAIYKYIYEFGYDKSPTPFKHQ